jgi:hypothetical protein
MFNIESVYQFFWWLGKHNSSKKFCQLTESTTFKGFFHCNSVRYEQFSMENVNT